MLYYRLGTVNEKHWGFKPVIRCSKPHTFSTFSAEEKEKNCPFNLFNKVTMELYKNDRKVNKYKIKNQEGMKKEKSLVQKVFCL